MSIMTVAVAKDGFWDPAANRARLEVGKRLIEVAGARKAQLLMLPAGFLTIRRHSPEAARAAASQLLSAAERNGLALLLGIDSKMDRSAGSKSPSRSKGPVVRRWLLGTGSRQVWEQRSVYPNDPVLRGDTARRSMAVGSQAVTVLACGEAFQPELRSSAEKGGHIVVNPCHTAHGARFSRALDWASEAHLCLLRSVHAANPRSVESGVGREPPIELPGPPLVLAQLRRC